MGTEDEVYIITFTQDELITLNNQIEGSIDYLEREHEGNGYLSDADSLELNKLIKFQEKILTAWKNVQEAKKSLQPPDKTLQKTGYCMYPGGVHECINNNGQKICGNCNYFTTDHPDARKIMIDNPDFLEIG